MIHGNIPMIGQFGNRSIDQIERISPTIKSRCQIFNFFPVNKKEIIDHLDKISSKGNHNQLLANLAQGRPGMAIKFMTHPDLLEKHNQHTALLLDLFGQDISERFKSLEKYTKKDFQANIEEAGILLDNWILALRDTALVKNLSGHYIANENFKNDFENLNTLGNRQIVKIINLMMAAKNYLAQNINPKLVLENLVLNL